MFEEIGRIISKKILILSLVTFSVFSPVVASANNIGIGTTGSVGIGTTNPIPVPSPSPTPTPVPTPSSSHYIDPQPANSIIMVAPSAPNSGYAIFALLKRLDGSVVTSQQNFDYNWTVEKFDADQEINLVPFSGCTNGIQEPCPNDHANISVPKVGHTSSANIWVTVTDRSTGTVLAKEEFVLNFVSASAYVSLSQIRPGYTPSESYKVGQQVSISWNMSGQPVDYYNIYYQYYEGSVLKGDGYIKSPTYPVTSTNWVIPQELAGKQVKVIVEARRNGIVVGHSNSDWSFTVNKPQTPEMIYPQDGQILDLEGAYMFKVKPVLEPTPGPQGYLFGFFQNGVMVYENWRDDKQLSVNGEFVITPSNPYHAKFQAGKVTVMVRAIFHGQWTDTRIINITLKPRIVQPTLLSYNLPVGWRTIYDKTGILQLGYNSAIEKATNQVLGITINGIWLWNPPRKLGYDYSISLQPYSNSVSPHNVLYNKLGIQQITNSGKPEGSWKSPNYHEKQYSYNSWNCLVIYGVNISQLPNVWGICQISNSKTILISLNAPDTNDKVVEQIISTIKLLKNL